MLYGCQNWGKNECFENKVASPHEMQPSCTPLNPIPDTESNKIPKTIIETYNLCKENRKLRTAANYKLRNRDEIKEGDYTRFYRERTESWHGPSLVTAINGGTVLVELDGRVYSSNISSIRKVHQPLDTFKHDDEIEGDPEVN